MANKLFGIADPYYDALRVQSNQAIWPDAGGSTSGLGGVLENKIYVWHADGSTIDTFDPTDAGLTSALTAAASGDTVWIPSFTISGNHTVPAGVSVYGISRTQSILTGQITLSAGSSLGNLSVSRSGGASNVTCIVGPSSGAARVINCLLLAVTTSGTPLAASSSGANTLYLEDCQISALKNSASVDPFGVSSGTLLDTFSIDSSVATYQYGAVATTLGVNYRVEVSGDVQYSMPAFPNKKWDANYATTDNWATEVLGWSMEFSDGSRPTSDEGTYQSSHVYNFTRPGTGAAFGGRVVDTVYGDNVGSWTVNVYQQASTYAVNVEGCEFDSTVSGIPQWGDRGAWDVINYSSRHAADIADGTYLYHHNPSRPTTSSFPWFNVKDYGAIGDGSNDDTSAISDTITAIPSSGGVLYFPAGSYKTSGGFVLSKQITVMGDGNSDLQVTPTLSVGLTTVTCTSQTAVLFTVAINGCSFHNLDLKNTYGGTPSSTSAGIQVTQGDGTYYNRVSFRGFYINLDIQDGVNQMVFGCHFVAPVKYGMKFRHIDAPDWGGLFVVACHFDAEVYAADAGFRFESGGGIVIDNCAFNAYGLSNLFKVSLDFHMAAGISTSAIQLHNLGLENWTDSGIKITTDATGFLSEIIITDCKLMNWSGNPGPAFNFAAANLGEIADILAGDNVFDSAVATTAIVLSKIDNVKVGTVALSGYATLLSQTSCTNIVVEGGGAGTVTSIATGTGLTGGPITTTGTISDANTGVAAATYGDATHVAQIAVNAQGRITSASDITITAGHAIQDEGVALPTEPNLNFTGNLVTATDNAGASRTDITIEATIPINVYNETQTADGLSTIYYLTNYAAPSTIRVYIDGIRQPASDDSAPTDVVSFGVAPDAGAVLLFDYEMDQT